MGKNMNWYCDREAYDGKKKCERQCEVCRDKNVNESHEDRA